MNIKQTITAALIALSATTASAAIPGKTYTPGDTIHIRGNQCLVISTDQTGQHGKAIMPPVNDRKTPGWVNKIVDRSKKKAAKKMEGKTPDQIIAETEKNLEKLVKKGHMTRQQADETLAQMRAGFEASSTDTNNTVDIETATKIIEDSQTTFNVQPVTFESEKKGLRTYLVKEWSATVPEGFRLPTSDDARDMMVTLIGGMGPAHPFSLTSALKKTRGFCSDIVFAQSLYMIVYSGFIVCDDMSSSDVRFCKPEQAGSTSAKKCMEISGTWRGEEYTIALTDF